MLGEMVAGGLVSDEQARLAASVPVCDDVTVEADSGGHTDNRPLVVLLPSMLELRDEVQAERGYDVPVRVGAAGGIGTPEAALAAFAMGAAYVVSGSINQSCLESGTSAHAKRLLAGADLADVMMAPAADMFEMGVKVQLLKRGTQFPMRAQRLYELYRQYDSIEAIPAEERERLERQIFRRSLDDVWRDTVAFFTDRDPAQVERAEGNPKRKMALCFRWYLGLSSRWANAGEAGREMDYQLWCGPAMGAFNDWARGTYLEAPENRRVADVAANLMAGAAYLHRLAVLRAQGFDTAPYRRHEPRPSVSTA
jgi:PfaD family protein